MRVGVEIEYWTVNEAGELASARDLAASCACAEAEFVDPLLEIKTPPCDSLRALSGALADRLGEVVRAARDRGLRLVPLGTPLADEPISRSSGPRIDVQRAILGDDLDHAANCAGAHVHFEQVGVHDQLRALTALDPALALVNTAPYYRDRRLVTCARPHAYRRLCYRRLPDHGRLWRYPRSPEEWRERIDERWAAFVDAAREAGVDRETVEATYDPEDAVWSPVRLRDDLGTVEWRAPDATVPTELLRLVAEVRRVLRRAVDRGTEVGRPPGVDGEAVTVPSFDGLRRRVDGAIERGLDDPGVAAYLERMGFDVDAYHPIGARIDGRDRLTSEEVRRLRRRYADRLERDVRSIHEADSDPTDRRTARAGRS